MEYISMILLIVVPLAQITLFVLHFLERRRSRQRNSAMLTYIDRIVNDVKTDCKDSINKFKIDALEAVQSEFSRQEQSISDRFSKLSVDYTEAQQAADKVNDFASSLASIFDYDPLKAIQKGRKKEAS